VMLTLAFLTKLAFDNNVWRQDINSDPSPFPASILVEYFFSHVRCWGTSPSSSEEEDTERHAYCLPGCTCSTKLRRTNVTTREKAMDRREDMGEVDSDVTVQGDRSTNRDGWSGSRAHVPVRIPDEFERRASIVVTLQPEQN
jgi:hypothetical protein